MVTTTIYVKPYLAAYMYVRYQNSVVTEFNAIRLKSIENLYHVIKNLTAKRPRNVSWRETGNLTLIIPDPRYGKDPETYNYLGHDSIIIIEEEIETMLKTELHSMMLKNKFRNGIISHRRQTRRCSHESISEMEKENRGRRKKENE